MMARRTVKLESLVNRDAEPRTRTEQVGLYDHTTTTYPLDLPHPKPGATIVVTDDPLPRVQGWLADIGRAIEAIRAEPEKYAKNCTVKVLSANVRACSVALTKLHALLREVQKGSPLSMGTIAMAIERGAGLAEAWERLRANAGLQKPMEQYRKIGDTTRNNPKIARMNAANRDNADRAALEEVRQWAQRALRRRAERDSLTEGEIIERYIKAVPGLARSRKERLRRIARTATTG